MGGAKWAHGHERGAGAGAARDAVEARGLNGCRERRGRQDGGEPPLVFPSGLTGRLPGPPEPRGTNGVADGTPATSVLDRETNRDRRGSWDRACPRPASRATGPG